MMQGGGDTGSRDSILLSIRGLRTHFYTDLGVSRALNGIDLEIPDRTVIGVVGESGCGKSVMALSVMQLVPEPGRIVDGEVTYHRRRQGGAITEIVDLTSLDPRGPEIRSIRGREIAMIFQEPMTSLNPSYTIGNQIMEPILLHQGTTRDEAESRAVDILRRVDMPNPGRVVRQYPHELSGGMRQRVMIAMALSCNPTLLFADEPTTALDVTTEAEILDLMRELQATFHMSVVFITHNLGVVAQMCDQVAVMYLGRVVEQSSVADLFYNPKHPYTSALLRSIPLIGRRVKEPLKPIRGMVPDPYSAIQGCPFHPRCDSAKPGVCDRYVPKLTSVDAGHDVRCFLYTDEGE